MVLYALRNSKHGSLATLRVRSNSGANNCNDVTCSLVRGDIDSVIWVVRNRNQCQRVLRTPPKWWQSSPKYPMIENPMDWEIVELTFEV